MALPASYFRSNTSKIPSIRKVPWGQTMAKVSNNLIAGQWVAGASSIKNRNPSDLSDVVGVYAQAEQAQLNDAVSAAQAVMPTWRAVGLEARQTMLDTIGRELMARAEELGTLLSREEGKPVAEGKGEIYRAGQFFTYYAAEVLRQLGENADSTRPNIEIDVRREPMGVVAVISPWNFPTATASWKIAPALAYGNAVIWKPANQTPASAWALLKLLHELVCLTVRSNYLWVADQVSVINWLSTKALMR